VEAIEGPVQALLAAIKGALPAIKRLSDADYPGAGWIGDNLDDDPHGPFATPLRLATALRMFRESAGDLGAFDYRFYVKDLGMDLRGAGKEILDSGDDDDANIQRVEAMRQYAAAVAR
jgi:hypothetical protein